MHLRFGYLVYAFFIGLVGVVVVAAHSNQIFAQSGVGCFLYNATDIVFQSDDTTGARADIFYTNPNLNVPPNNTETHFSYHRIAVADMFPVYNFYEVGWVKQSKVNQSGQRYTQVGTLVSYLNLQGTAVVNSFTQKTVTGSHNYQVKYVASQNAWKSFFDGTFLNGSKAVSGTHINFTIGDAAVVGGEACKGVEDFTCVKSYNLQTRGYFGGTTQPWRFWNDRDNYIDNGNYVNQEADPVSITAVYSNHSSLSCTVAPPQSQPTSTPTFDDSGDN